MAQAEKCHQDVSATVNPASRRVWRDTRNGITVDVGYPHTHSLDPDRFGLTFAPVLHIQSKQTAVVAAAVTPGRVGRRRILFRVESFVRRAERDRRFCMCAHAPAHAREVLPPA